MKIVYSNKQLVQLSRVISHALRHEPWLYELELDVQGWVSIGSLLDVLRGLNMEWRDLSESDLQIMIELSEKKRHEINDGKMRALYGHSLPGKLLKEKMEPPEFLYHGTAPETVSEIKLHGLLPMNRQYVHLSVDIETAKQVGQRKSPHPVILIVRAKKAYQHNVHFYCGNDLVWLADYIPEYFINFTL